jgi:hypothetical protein
MSLEMENKSTNHHNCRKSALLSKLLIKNKLLMLLGCDVKAFIEKNTDAYKRLIITHAERFIELASMVFDIYPFIPFLGVQTRQEIVDELTAKVASVENPQRHARALITLFKVKKVFGLL